ncbi:MAG: Thymidylate synthase ThyX [Dehalococcoidia bacterium]|nr:Thymidylate synthase ThyX [Chloroflexota bacterium]
MPTTAKIIADSISPQGVRLTTFELEFPRIILAEFNTHRMFSRNAASTRAIPIKQQLEYIVNGNLFIPTPFTEAQKGMVSNEPAYDQESAAENWYEVLDAVDRATTRLADLGVHKQHAGRLLEPFTYIKVVCSATEFSNFWWLRDHQDAQPEMQELARSMLVAYLASNPRVLEQGEWHVPYYGDGAWAASSVDSSVDDRGNTLADAIAISASCCAQVSYRKSDDSLEKARDIYKRLVESLPPHMSPFEHQATPMHVPKREAPVFVARGDNIETLDTKGTTHYDRFGWAWSGNFCGWVQHRQLIPDNAKRG